MVIRVSEIPDEGLSFEGPAAFPRAVPGPHMALEDLALAVEKDGDTVFVHGGPERAGARRCARAASSPTT